MANDPMTQETRNSLIAEHEELWAEYVGGSADDSLTYEDAEDLKSRFRAVRTRYFDGLPRPYLSRCPFCEAPFAHSFDPWGFDGYWWLEKAYQTTAEPTPCEHFGVLQGAVHLMDLPPEGSERLEANVGPAVPFVIPRILESSSVVAVVSSLPMSNGYTAYPIVYFSGRPSAPGAFTQPWTRSSYNFPDGRGGFAWRLDTDPWDFDLEPWIREEKVLWIDPNDPQIRIRSDRDGPCPYVDLEGTRQRQYVKGTELWTVPAPKGDGVDPFAE